MLLARTCALLRLGKFFSALTVIAFAAWGCSFGEAGNGMEMGLLAAACLLMVNELLSPQPRLLLLGTGVVLAVTTRFEAVLYVGLLGLTVVSVPGRRAFWTIVLTGLGTVALLSVWRLAVFSDVLPNTFWAKRWPPYAAFGLGHRVAGAVELLRFFVVPLLALAIAGRSGFAPRARCAPRRTLAILAAPILGAVVVGVLAGESLGLSRTDALLRVPAGAVAAVAALLGLGEQQEKQVPGGARRRPVPVQVTMSKTGFPPTALKRRLQGRRSS